MSESAAGDGRRPFRGFRSPAYTQVPDELFDELLPDLSGAELKTLLYVIRRTFGFKREADSISLSQMLHGLQGSDGRRLDRGVGISKPTLLQSLRGLEEKQVIVTERRRSAEKGNEPTVYRLRFAEDALPTDDLPPTPEPLVKKFDQGVVKKFDHPLVKKFDQGVVKKFDQDRKTVKDKQLKTEFEIRREKAEVNPMATTAEEAAGKGAVANTGHIPETDPLLPSSVDQEIGPGRRGRPPGSLAEREQLQGYLADFARELRDDAPLPATITRVLNLFRRAGTPATEWADYLYRARAITQERTAQIRSGPTESGRPWSPKNKIPYFFAVLEDLLGLRRAAADGSTALPLPWDGHGGDQPQTRTSRPEVPGSPRTGDRPRT
jgi:hypothetical protein